MSLCIIAELNDLQLPSNTAVTYYIINVINSTFPPMIDGVEQIEGRSSSLKKKNIIFSHTHISTYSERTIS